jgi:hypothetical protein
MFLLSHNNDPLNAKTLTKRILCAAMPAGANGVLRHLYVPFSLLMDGSVILWAKYFNWEEKICFLMTSTSSITVCHIDVHVNYPTLASNRTTP